MTEPVNLGQKVALKFVQKFDISCLPVCSTLDTLTIYLWTFDDVFILLKRLPSIRCLTVYIQVFDLVPSHSFILDNDIHSSLIHLKLEAKYGLFRYIEKLLKKSIRLKTFQFITRNCEEFGNGLEWEALFLRSLHTPLDKFQLIIDRVDSETMKDLRTFQTQYWYTVYNIRILTCENDQFKFYAIKQ
ncbi:unnamed protein product [Didymodactylos carnosus]|uniref:Uncharacterized protein n=1 Tax=Didymodactylos carnosus TaxID=1234261 RepID=A0A8S2FV12_9BILA|nr:unnamed protein product [Didymodactylos carnosus]CAF4357878.1 unnamed protein product [Didymodactylos carnosus]